MEQFRSNEVVGPFRRVLCAAIGLIAGNAVMLMFLLYSALRLRAALLNVHMGQPQLALSGALGIFVLYALFSILGWALAGLPIALAFPARVLSRVPWPLCLLIGAALGPLALLLIFAVLAVLQGSISSFSLSHTENLWPFSILVSTVSFLVYAALLRRQLQKTGQQPGSAGRHDEARADS